MSHFLSRLVTSVSQRTRLRILTFITIADTGLISYVSTRNLAERWGFGALSWLYPLCLDAVAAIGMDLWMSNSPAKRAAACLSLTAVTLSLAANVADWLYVGPGAAVLGAVPPLMLAALLFTMHVHAAPSEHAPNGTDTEQSCSDVLPDEVPPAPPQQLASRRPAKGPKPYVPDHEVLAALRAHEENAKPLSRRRAMSMFNMGTDRANRLLAEARDETTQKARNGTQFDLTALNPEDDS